MDLKVVEQQLRSLQTSLQTIDVGTLSGSAVAALVSVLTSHKNCVDALLSRAVAQGVSTNQHNADGSRSGASWVASKLGVSEKEARSALAAQKKLSALSDVQDAVSKGDISMSKASAIGEGAGDNAARAAELLDVARSANVEAVQRRAQEMHASENIAQRRKRFRESQFITLRKNGDSMATGSFQLLPEVAASFIEAYNASRGDTSWQRAEDFAQRLGGSGKRTTTVVFHVDVVDDEVTDVAEMRGMGPVSTSIALDALADASRAFVGTVNNKLAWFSEQDMRKKVGDLPDSIKRAIKRHAYDRCICGGLAEEVDHAFAKTNGGEHQLGNLQALCEECHHAKTKRDAPWTVPRFYAKQKEPPAETLFPDAG